MDLRDTLLVCILCNGSYIIVTKDRVEAGSPEVVSYTSWANL